MSECHDCWYHFCVFVFMLPVFARSSSNELGQRSQHAAPLQFFEKNTGVLTVEWELFPLT